MADEEQHEHSWQANGIVHEEQIARSPVSVLDHQVRTLQYAVSSCSCGAVRRTLAGRSPWRWLNRG